MSPVASPAHSLGQTGQTPRLLSQLLHLLLRRSRNLFPNDSILFSKRDRVYLKLINLRVSARGRGVKSKIGKWASLQSEQPSTMWRDEKAVWVQISSGQGLGRTLYPRVLAESPATHQQPLRKPLFWPW